jgi:ferric-dicitrate binding protein FerR (iron transport regulator)
LNIVRELIIKDQKKVIRLRWMKVAATILLLVGLSGSAGYFISRSSYQSTKLYTEIIVQKGERSTVVLPDGSTVQLNSDSRLKFLSSFNSGNRHVTLEGEGLFTVKHDESNPFIVETPSFSIEDLGTVFNVSCYLNDQLETTFLESGKLKINIGNKEGVFLNPNESYSYNKITHESIKTIVQNKRLTDWTKGFLTVDGETIGELAKKLERKYNIHFVFSDEEAKQHTYTGRIKDENLNTVLEALVFASSVKYVREKDTITLSSKR